MIIREMQLDDLEQVMVLEQDLFLSHGQKMAFFPS